MENSFKSVIDQSRSILILLPTKPYFDQVAAALGLYLSLRNDKDTQVYSPSPMTVEFNRLIGVNKVTGELGNKNLVIRFTDYKASDIERVSYDIENSQFRLTVIPKQKIAPPTKDQIDLSYAGVSSDTVIIIGGANESHFPALSSKDLSGANIVHVGTRDLSMTANKSYVSFSRPASSVSEIVAVLLKDGGYSLDEDISTNLLMGIENASNTFQDPAVNAETFSVVSELMRKGGKRLSTQAPVQRRDFPVGSIPGSMPPKPFVPRTPTVPVQQDPMQTPPQTVAQTPAKAPQAVDEEKPEDKAPDEWLQPKIYKGTSIS